MPDEPLETSPDEEVLASLFRTPQDADGRPPDAEDLVRRHPELAREIRELDALRRALDQSRGTGERPMPERLGEFRIVRRLETGGMGDVFEAWQEPLNRRVAVKVLRQGQHSPAARERFMREQRVLARLHQTNIVPIHTAGRAGVYEYFAMPYIDGAALRHVVHAAAEFSGTRPDSKTPAIADLIARPPGESAERPAPAASEAQRPGEAGRPSRRVFRPSLEYLRSVARVMAEAAEAVQHAHEQGVLHRDIKPSNIMVAPHATADGRRADQCWVIDFGLASYHAESPAAPGASGMQDSPSLREVPAVTSGIMGTPSYMAPEQFEGRADERSDVWGLGVTLYELLTLQRAFPLDDVEAGGDRVVAAHQLIRDTQPPRPRGLVPRDLQAICFRALRKDPAERYASARALAEDLRRWLRREAVVAREDESPLLAVPIRSTRWAQRNKGWASALGLGVCVLFLVVLSGFLDVQARRRAAEQAFGLQELELVTAGAHSTGWSDSARELARSVGELGADDRLRDAYATTLAGLDARRLATKPLRASSLVFGRTRDELLLGGAPALDEWPAVRAKTWGLLGEPLASGLDSPGPVACRADGTRVQFVAVGETAFRVWDMDRGVSVADCLLPTGTSGRVAPVLNELRHPTLAMDQGGSVVAASLAGRADGMPDSVCVWDATTGGLLASLPRRASALTFSADGRCLATGCSDGRVEVWRLPSGERIAEVQGADGEVQSLAFGSVTSLSAGADPADLALAIGCSTGRIAVCDVATGQERVRCRGMAHRVLALAFSPDGVQLAAAGENVRLWDAATGAELLKFGCTFGNAVAFSADGQRLAFSTFAAFESTGGVEAWDLQFDRGLRSLRGLAVQPDIVTISRDEQRVAALSGDWHVAVWDAAGALLFRVPVPHGISQDNAALAFSDDSTRLAFVSGSEARTWDLRSGRVADSWQLAEGLGDRMAFDAQGEFLAARFEAADGGALPPGRARCVCRVRRLSVGGAAQTLLEVSEFEEKLTSAVLDPRGRYVVVEGVSRVTGVRQRAISCYDIASGRRLWTEPSTRDRDMSSLQVDPTGAFVAFDRGQADRALVAMPDGVPMRLTTADGAIGPDASFLLTTDDSVPRSPSMALARADGSAPFLRLRNGRAVLTVTSLSGQLVAYGREDGTVTLADLSAIREQLADMGLGW